MIDHAPNEEAVTDEIIAEARAHREALAAEHGYDVRRLFSELKRRELASTRPKAEAAEQGAMRGASS